MDNDRVTRQLAVLAGVVEHHRLDGLAYMDLVARYSLHPAAVGRVELPQFAYALSRLIAHHPELTFPAAKIARTLRARIERLRSMATSTPGEVTPAIEYADSPAGERAELEGLRNRIVECGAPAFVDYVNSPEMIPCVPVQLMVLREPDCLEWPASRLVAVLDGMIAGDIRNCPIAFDASIS